MTAPLDPTSPADEPTLARRVALHCSQHPYFGRDQDLARGWLAVLGALDRGEDVRAAIHSVAVQMVNGRNDGLPLSDFPEVAESGC